MVQFWKRVLQIHICFWVWIPQKPGGGKTLFLGLTSVFPMKSLVECASFGETSLRVRLIGLMVSSFCISLGLSGWLVLFRSKFDFELRSDKVLSLEESLWSWDFLGSKGISSLSFSLWSNQLFMPLFLSVSAKDFRLPLIDSAFLSLQLLLSVTAFVTASGSFDFHRSTSCCFCFTANSLTFFSISICDSCSMSFASICSRLRSLNFEVSEPTWETSFCDGSLARNVLMGEKSTMDLPSFSPNANKFALRW